MRLFIALELDGTARGAVGCAADALSFFGKGSFCKRQSYHITLAFLGEQEDATAAKRAMDSISFLPFELSLGELGKFGDTYYVGVKRNDTLTRLWKELCAALKNEGFDIEARNFVPHVTVARRFKPSTEPTVFVPAASWLAKRMVLMQTLDRGEYAVLHAKAQ